MKKIKRIDWSEYTVYWNNRYHFQRGATTLYHMGTVLHNIISGTFLNGSRYAVRQAAVCIQSSGWYKYKSLNLQQKSLFKVAENCTFLPLIVHDTYCKLHGDCTLTIESEASFIAEHRFKHKHYPVEWCVFQKKSDPWTTLHVLSHHCTQFIQPTVCIHLGFLCVKRDWSFSTTRLRGVEERKCLQLHSVLAFKEWENGIP